MARILFVCTANVCRSPYLELRLRAVARGRGIDGVEVASAGTRAAPGHPIATELLDRLARDGIDGSGHGAHRLSADDLEASDLVLTATRAHRREVSQLQPGARERVFTVLQFTRLLSAATPPRRGTNDLPAVIAAALAARGRTGGGSDDDDLADPWGRSAATYRRVAEQMDGSIETLARALAP